MFCSAPWEHIFIDTNGDAKTCCAAKQTIGNIRKQSIESILASNTLTSIRENIKNESWCNNCIACKEIEDNGGVSERFEFNNQEIKEYIHANLNFFIPRILDIRWDNTCNLACVYCDGKASSAWNKVDNLFSKIEVNEENIKNFKDYLLKNKDQIQQLWLLGGEPLLMKENLELLTFLPDDIPISITSNLSIPNLNKSAIWHELKKKKNISYRISFENIDKKFEYVRFGAKWDVFTKNLDELSKITQNIFAAATYNIFSAYDISSLYSFCEEKKIQISLQMLNDPKVLNIFNFPKEYKLKAAKEIEKTINSFHDYRGKNVNTLLNIKSALENSENELPNILEKYNSFINDQEVKLKKNLYFKDLWTDFYI
jgi:hypothetical protein